MKKIIALACACAGMCVLSDTAESLSADPLRGTPAQQPRAEILAGTDGLREHMRDNIKEAMQNYGCSVQ